MLLLVVGALGAIALAAYIYLGRERLGAVGAGLATLRALALVALLVAFINPSRDVRLRGGPTTVLLDASLSMEAAGAHWAAALDSARAHARQNSRSAILRFGLGVRPFDSLGPADGATHLADALRVAAGREGNVVVVSDGQVDDWASIPPELARGVTFVTLPHDSVSDVALLDVSLPGTIQRSDTTDVGLTIGTWRFAADSIWLEISDGRDTVLRARLGVPRGTGTATRTVRIAARRLPLGRSALRFALRARDDEPRDDARLRVVDVVETPAIVVIADPADVEGRFLFSGIASVAPGRVRGFARIAPDRWVDMRTSAPVRGPDVMAAARQAVLLVVRGTYAVGGRTGPVWTWAAGSGQVPVLNGDWYAAPAAASPLSASLSEATWDSLPPLTALAAADAGAGGWVAVTARLARSGVERAVVSGRDSAGSRRMLTTGLGLWRWSLRGGADREAYRAMLAAGVDWLLAQPPTKDATLTASATVPRGMPVTFQWHGNGAAPDKLVVKFVADSGSVLRTLRLQNGAAATLLDPGVYRWQVPTLAASGLVAVEPYSDEFHPGSVTLAPAGGLAGMMMLAEQARERWWLFGLAIAAFIAEWFWRQRRGLP